MLIPRIELRFDFKGAEFDLSQNADLEFLGWIFNQFLYGEVTGIQCGHWLYRAPHLNAAAFLARQASEELSHVRRILKILAILGKKPRRAHWAIRFLSTGMMGGSWGEHVALEMALGEGLVLGIFYAMADTIPHPEIQKILNSALADEERHVEFGEQETLKWLAKYPQSRPLLFGLALAQLGVLRALRQFVLNKIKGEFNFTHPVIQQFDAFYRHTVFCFEQRMEKLGLLKLPFHEISLFKKGSAVALLPFQLLRQKILDRSSLLTETYLNDPVVLGKTES